jgi:uncharacterized membrane protein YjjP (DUF1212 family)
MYIPTWFVFFLIFIAGMSGAITQQILDNHQLNPFHKSSCIK